MTQQPYQLLPPLTDDEYAALREDIEANGIRVPVDVDEAGQVLDGHHRQRIAAEMGIDCPVRVITGLTEDDKRAHAVAVNVHRRALTVSQRRELVQAELERDPSRSDRAIGRLCGVDGKTVAAMRTPVRNSAPVEEFTPEMVAEARRRTDQIREVLGQLDADILMALIRGVPAIQLVGELTANFENWNDLYKPDAQISNAVRDVVCKQRVKALVAWPDSGWYADELRLIQAG
jgi:ParB-like chromosome segregation protein Spo0J